MTNRADIDRWIKIRLDVIESLMDCNAHLKDRYLMEALFTATAPLYVYMDEADKDYYEAAKFAAENERAWVKETEGD